MPRSHPMLVDFAAFQQPPSALFRDYLAGSAATQAFFQGGGFHAAALGAAAEHAARQAGPRAAAAAALARQQRARRAERAAAAAERLALPGAAAVVTGQQPVLLGGPLYVLWKALSALRVASELEAARGQPVVPVFWVAADDHDFAEVRSTTLIDDSGRLRSIRLAAREEPVGQPVSRIRLEAPINEALDEAAACLPASLHREWLVELLRACYRPEATVAGAFACFLSALLPELVVLDPSDPQLKRLMEPVMRREIEEGSPSSRLAAEMGPRLLDAGYHQQVPVRDGFYNLFLYRDGERRALARTEGGVEVRGTGRRLPVAEVLELLAAQPEQFSPGVLLRPLAQDALLPTAGYVGGPAEIAYHAQIGTAYAHFGLSRPVLLPRPSLTLVEAAQSRAMEAERLSLADLEGDPETLLLRWAREAYPDVEAAFARASEAVDRELLAVEERLGALDPTLRAAADAARGRALHQVETLHEKATRALKKRDQSRAERLRRTRDALFPGGALQERGLGLVGALARHGPALLQEVRDAMDPWARGHQVLSL